MGKWHSFDKEVWFIRGPSFLGSAFLRGKEVGDQAPYFFVQGFTEGFKTAQLHQVLWLASAQFPNHELLCESSRGIGAQLRELAQQGLIEIHPEALGRYRVAFVARPFEVGDGINYLYEKLWFKLLGLFRTTIPTHRG